MYMLMQREESEEYQGYEWSCANLYWNLNWISFNFQVDFSLLLLCTRERYIHTVLIYCEHLLLK